MEKLQVEISWSGDNFVASSILNGLVIVTHKNLDALKIDFKEALKFHVETSIEDGDKLPNSYALGKYEIKYHMHISAILKELDGLVTRAALSKAVGMNEKQLGHYIQGKKTPREETRQRILHGIKKLGNEILSVV